MTFIKRMAQIGSHLLKYSYTEYREFRCVLIKDIIALITLAFTTRTTSLGSSACVWTQRENQVVKTNFGERCRGFKHLSLAVFYIYSAQC